MTNISTEYGVCTYDAPSLRWYSYCPDWGGDLTTMTDRHGYWIYVTNPCTLTIDGSEPASPYDISLFTGWNLVGLPHLPEPANTEDILAGIMANISTEYGICTYDAQSLRWYSYCHDWGGDLTTMTDGHGYWIYVTNPCTLTIDGE